MEIENPHVFLMLVTEKRRERNQAKHYNCGSFNGSSYAWISLLWMAALPNNNVGVKPVDKNLARSHFMFWLLPLVGLVLFAVMFWRERDHEEKAGYRSKHNRNITCQPVYQVGTGLRQYLSSFPCPTSHFNLIKLERNPNFEKYEYSLIGYNEFSVRHRFNKKECRKNPVQREFD